MRVLSSKELMPLDGMDFTISLIDALKRIAKKPHGIILCVGPTGSGKTTTLHSLLGYINTDSGRFGQRKIPLKLRMTVYAKCRSSPKIGLTFAVAMRAFLRADPDVIMIGEMRDKETADIAIEASLSLAISYFSTMHTNSSVETVTRILGFGL